MIISGDIDAVQLESLVDKNFSSWKGKGANPADPDFGTPATKQPTVGTLVEPGMPTVVTYAVLRPWHFNADLVIFNQKRLVDLPGYGYAEGPREQRRDWAGLIEALAPRRSLKGLMVVVDVRRGLRDGDEQLLAWAQLYDRPVHVLLSKADQLTRAGARAALAAVQAQLAGRAAAQLFSARDGTGVDAARERLQAWLGDARQE